MALRVKSVARRGRDSNVYAVEWETQNDGRITWEEHKLVSTDHPRPELDAAIDEMGTFLVAFCELKLTTEEARGRADIKSVAIEYDGDNRSIVIKGYVLLKNGNWLKLTSPSWPINDGFIHDVNSETVRDRELRYAVSEMNAEIVKYIDGERAQTTLGLTEGRDVEASNRIAETYQRLAGVEPPDERGMHADE